MNNTRFATIVHILTLLAKFPDQWLNSDWIAESISINPAIATSNPLKNGSKIVPIGRLKKALK